MSMYWSTRSFKFQFAITEMSQADPSRLPFDSLIPHVVCLNDTASMSHHDNTQPRVRPVDYEATDASRSRLINN